jgi:OmpA-OmpF porin, OOP family
VATDLVSDVKNAIRGDALHSIASALGEDPARTEAALGAAVPALTAALATRASTNAGASDLIDLMRRNNVDPRQYGDAPAAIAASDGVTRLMSAGKPLLDSVLGGRTGAVADWVASQAGIGRASSTSLLTLALPVVLGQISRRISAGGWSPANLMGLWAGQPALPAGAPAGLASALGLAEAGARRVGTYDTESAQGPKFVGTYEHERPAPAAYVAEPRKANPWLWAIPLLLLVPLLGWLFTRGGPTQDVALRATAPVAVPAVRPTIGPLIDRRLPTTVVLHIPANGVESRLIAFIEDPAQQASRETWFSFDRIEFPTDSATLTPASSEQVHNVAEILKAYPGVNVKIGGYTDNVGDPGHNQQLSQDRATNTMNAIVSNGVDKARLEAEGYGETHPVASNDTAEGRQQNRRIDIRVTQK